MQRSGISYAEQAVILFGCTCQYSGEYSFVIQTLAMALCA